MTVVVKIFAKPTFCGYLGVVLEVVEHLAWAEVRCRVVRRLILELELDIKNSSGAWILAVIVVIILRASLDSPLQVWLVSFNEANDLIFLGLHMLFALNRAVLIR